jgi:hypothetical protein
VIDVSSVVLPRAEWEPLALAHAHRSDEATAGRRERAAHGEKHPIEDFLYDYYGTRPSLLRRWHPGIGVELEEAVDHAPWRFYRTAGGLTGVDAHLFLESRGSTVAFIESLLRATASRPAQRGCFGLHEWAMVYRDADTRHPLPLRLGRAGTDHVVESHGLVCTHIDAFRFFTADATPRNSLQLTRADQPAHEQPGCLHANMDLFKWATKLAPAVSSELALDAFELAMEIRYVDMQASPYDVSGLGLPAIAIETADGKNEYARRQGQFAARAEVLRGQLITACEHLRSRVAAEG